MDAEDDARSRGRSELGLLIHEAAPLFVTALHAGLQARGRVVPPNYRYVFKSISPGGTSVSDLAAANGVTTQAVSKVVQHMERAGLAERQPSPVDARVTMVTLTSDGTALRDDVLGVHQAIEAQLAEVVGRDDVETTRRTLLALIELTTTEALT